MPIYRFTLPLPPSANRYWRTANNRVYVSSEAKSYKQECGWLARTQADADMPLAGAVAVTMRFYRQRKAGDLSNFVKVLEDALNGIVWVDDKQIVDSHQWLDYDKHNPRVELEVREVA